MQLLKHVNWILGTTAAITVSIIALIILLNRTAAPPLSAQHSIQPTACPADWWKRSPSPTDIENCANEKATREVEEANQELTQEPLKPASIDPTPATPTYTPGPLGYIPSELQVVEPVDPIEFFDGPPWGRGANSAWRLGAVYNFTSHEVSKLFLQAFPPVPGKRPVATLQVFVSGNDGVHQHTYNRAWVAPQDIGTITITAIQDVEITPTGITGVAVLSTTTGLRGTFDLGSESWDWQAR